MMKKLFFTMFFLGLAHLAVCPELCIAKGQGMKVPVGLEEFIAQEVMHFMENEYKFYEGSIITYAEISEDRAESFIPLRVWRYEEGKLIDDTPESFQVVMGLSRGQWPPYTFIFVVDEITPEVAVVDLRTIYDRGIEENSRGGNSQKWMLSKSSGKWEVTEKKSGVFWD